MDAVRREREYGQLEEAQTDFGYGKEGVHPGDQDPRKKGEKSEYGRRNVGREHRERVNLQLMVSL